MITLLPLLHFNSLRVLIKVISRAQDFHSKHCQSLYQEMTKNTSPAKEEHAVLCLHFFVSRHILTSVSPVYPYLLDITA